MTRLSQYIISLILPMALISCSKSDIVSGEAVLNKPKNESARSDAPFLIPIEGKPGFMKNPHDPNGELIDVRSLPEGILIRDFDKNESYRVPKITNPSPSSDQYNGAQHNKNLIQIKPIKMQNKSQ